MSSLAHNGPCQSSPKGRQHKMPQDVRILSARRAFEFAVDELRITMLSLPAVIAQIQQLFQFQAAQVGTPPETFGPIPATFPPGLVFAQGQFIAEDQQLVFIRTLAIEPRRIVIDVSAPSSTIDPIASLFMQVAASIQSPDGSPVIGQPQRVLDHSEVAFDWSATALQSAYSPALWELIGSHITVPSGIDHVQVVPTMSFYLQPAEADFPGATNTGHGLLQLAPRAGTKPAEGHYFSRAPLPSEAHIAYLEALDRSLLSSPATR